MKVQPNKFFRLLLRLYPSSFRERVGDAMMQAVIDTLADSTRIEKLNMAGNLAAGAAIENSKAIWSTLMDDRRSKSTRQYLLGFLLILPGIVMISLLVLGINPPLGPLEPYLSAENPAGKWVALAAVLTAVLVLPLVGVWTAIGGSKPNFRTIFAASAIGIFLVSPFIALQVKYGSRNYSSFPLVLFAILWILPTIAICVVAPVFAAVRPTESSALSPWSIGLRIVALLPMAIMWVALIQDQIPCFLGVPNCD